MTSAPPNDVKTWVTQITERAERLAARMADAGGADVEVLAVCKGHPVEAAIAAVAGCGFTKLGENYAQDLRAKAEVMADLPAELAAGLTVEPADVVTSLNVAWHFIGQLQTNKVRQIAEHVAVWQSVDRLKVGLEIAKRAPAATVFAQVNLSNEPHKAGCEFDELDPLVEALAHAGLQVDGLMGVGSAADDAQTAIGFAQLRAATDRLGLRHCSMGMTADLELAIEHGSTMVRVGSDLFGPRQ